MTLPKKFIVGFDFGDAESALTNTTRGAADSPSKMQSRFSSPNSGMIRSIIGYGNNGQIFIGDEIEPNIHQIDEANLHLSFKKIPTYDDKEYAKLVRDFINHLWKDLTGNLGVRSEDTHVIIGHPTRWKTIDGGEPVEVLQSIISETELTKNGCDFSLVAESRGAAIEAIENTSNTSVGSFFTQGWSLVIDMGSSTCDFTAVNVSEKKSAAIEHGDEIGARLIDREIMNYFTNGHNRSEEINDHLRVPKNRVLFEMHCRNAKEKFFNVGNAHENILVPADNGEDIFVQVKLNDSIMDDILLNKDIVNYKGKHMSWRESFHELLRHVQQLLKNKDIENIQTIFLTGGASKMSFAVADCLEVFQNLKQENILRDSAPQYSIALGLARWGRLQARTDDFQKEIEAFSETEMRATIENNYEDLLDKIATKLSNVAINISKNEFKKWINGNTTYISTVESKIKTEVEEWVKYEFKDELDPIIVDWLTNILRQLKSRVSQIESKYNLPNETLSKSFGLSSMDSTMLQNKVDTGQFGDSNEIAASVSDMFGNVIAVVVGIVSYVALPTVLAVIIPIILYIVTLVSAKLAIVITGILAAIPGVGWAALLAIGAASMGMLVKDGSFDAIKDSVAEKIRDWDLPQWVRNRVSYSNVSDEIDTKKKYIINEVYNALASDENMKNKVISEIYDKYVIQLDESVEDARLLIK